MIEIRAEILATDESLIELDVFIIDMANSQYVMEAAGTARLLYADGEEAASIAFDEFFGNENGSFKIGFNQVADYLYKGVELVVTSPVTETKLIPFDTVTDVSHSSGDGSLLGAIGPSITEL